MLILLAACAIQPAPPVATIERITSADLAAVQQEAMKAAAKVGIDNVLVIFDIDNTLMAMEQDLGSDQWYDWQKQLQEHDRCDERLVADRLAAAGALYYASGMRPTQPDAAEIVRAIQARGFTTFALTSRGHEFRLHTFRELRRNGIDFEDSAPGPRGGYPDIFMPERGVRVVRYEDGIMLTAGQQKGDMLASLLKKTGHAAPQALVVVDDKPNHLVDYGNYARENRVSLTAIHYTGEAEVLKKFDGEEVTRQWRAIVAALDTLQHEFGTDHYELPDSHRPEGCPATD
jgi:hypothetical protein